MFPVTLTITNIDQLTKVMAALSLVQPVRVPTANEMVAEILNNEAAMADTKDTPAPAGEAPGKSSAAKTAPSPPTAEAAPSQPAPSAAAPATKAPEATPPAADAPSASVPAFDYAELARAVNSRISKFGKEALLAVAKKHGADTFKALPADKWAAAHADVVALGA